MGKVTEIDHPIVKHKLTQLRNKDTTTKDFQEIVKELSTILAYEVTRDLPLEEIEIETPLVKTMQPVLKNKNMVIVPILRAGLGMVDGFTDLLPYLKVGHIGIYRDPETKEAVEYFKKLPKNLDESEVIVVDPMLATGGSAIAALDILKQNTNKPIKLVNIVACPEGIKAIQEAHPDVDIYTAVIDEKLNDNKYILPGLGDAGDRIFGTN